MVLKLKSMPPPPRKLQPWQAYHALTYKSQWKPHVDQAWTDYKKAWEDEHPEGKLEKTRFQIMVEFMKAKFEDEDEEMKKKCNNYRKPEGGDAMSLEPVGSASAVNNEFQVWVLFPPWPQWINKNLIQVSWHASTNTSNHQRVTDDPDRMAHNNPCWWTNAW